MEDMDIPLPPRAPSPLYSPTSPTSDHEEDKSAAAAEAAAKASKPVLSREVIISRMLFLYKAFSLLGLNEQISST